MRWKKRYPILLWSGVILTFLVVAALALNFAVDLFLRAMVPTTIEEAMESIESTSSTATEAAPSSESTPQTQPEVTEDETKAESASQENVNENEEKGSAGTTESTTVTEPAEETTLNYSPEITPEKAKLVEEEITIKEKAKVMATLMGKLSPSEIALFTRMASNGLTVDEKKEAKKVFLEKLTEAEYNELIAIASKYGLSEGKSHEDSLKDMEAE